MSFVVLRLGIVASTGLGALAELQPQVELPNSTAPAVAANSTSLADQLQRSQQDMQGLAACPFWCDLIPTSWRPAACEPRWSRSVTPLRSAGDLPLLCQGIPPEQRARTAACTYSEQEAVRFAALSTASYCTTEAWRCGEACSSVPDMRSVRLIDDDSLDAHAYVGRLGEACVIAFRGTDSLSGWAEDFESLTLAEFPGCSFNGKPCGVGLGFLEIYQSVSKRIQGQLSAIGCTTSTPLFVTGHSLGAALATLTLFDFTRLGYNVAKAYTFGQPRVGDAAFASAFNRAMVWTPVFRVTKRDDPFVYLPSRDPFHHVGTEVYYRGDTTEGYRICDGSGEDATCQDSEGNGDVASLLLKCVIPQECGHLNYLQPLMRYPLGHASCTSSWTGILFP